jgi:hypothetical protein
VRDEFDEIGLAGGKHTYHAVGSVKFSHSAPTLCKLHPIRVGNDEFVKMGVAVKRVK